MPGRPFGSSALRAAGTKRSTGKFSTITRDSVSVIRLKFARQLGIGLFMRRSMNNPKMHHYVPRSYLARFTDKDGFLHVFDRSSHSSRRQRPKEVMKINYYYRQEWAPAGVDPNILEKTFGEWLETVAKDSIDRLIRCPAELTDEDTATLLTYIEMQRIRVPRQSDMAKKLMRATILRLAPADAVSAIQSGEVLLTMKDSARFDYMRMIIGELYPWFGRMEWEVFEAESGSAFITTDSPVSLYNSEVPPPAEAGLALAGTFVFFPLSSNYALLMRHPEYRKDSNVSAMTVLPDPPNVDSQLSITHGVVWNQRIVYNFNWKMMQLSDRLIVGESKDILEACTSS